ncbi:putative methyltransferase BTM2-like [Acipenser ruthenus]|uniref:Putative methyltransferase BTM2-like n=1 Tax=Acipenser ruthenus TaxID=7906 RepID=A0A444ULM4_ACIRT|nr:putative methyltransferase BTM2-like [Acipenser ruthenus]
MDIWVRERVTEPGQGQNKKLEQEKLSGVVKSVHRKLRKKYREVGDFDKIWREHCEDEETLSEYAVAMKNLADNHWAKTCEGEGRIEWCRRLAHLSGKIRLLDVGSCFNPFLKFDEFLTVGIDIVPAVQNRHAMMMKSWKIAIESLGFKRYKYVKFSHMHLIAFRKVSLKTTSDLVSRNYPEMLYIPQDFNNADEEEYSDVAVQVRSDLEDDQMAYNFMELPDAPYDSDSGDSQTSSIPVQELEDPILLQS